MLRKLIDEVLEPRWKSFYLWVAYLRYFILFALWAPIEILYAEQAFFDIGTIRIFGCYMFVINTLCVASLRHWRLVLANLTLCGASDVFFGALVFYMIPGLRDVIVILYVFEIGVTGLNYSPLATVFMAVLDLSALLLVEVLRATNVAPYLYNPGAFPASWFQAVSLIKFYYYTLFIVTGAYVAYITTRKFGRKEREVRDYAENLEQKVMERTSELAALNELKDEFLLICSHDLKSPLTTIGGYAELIQSSLEELDPAEIKEYLGRLRNESHKMSEFIGELLDLARFETGRFELSLGPAYLTTVVRLCYEEFAFQAEEKGVELTFAPPADELPPLLMDRRRMEQVVNNLLANALKFTPEGGAVVIRVYANGEDSQAIEVADDGPGIPGEELGRIFDKFYQVRKGRRVERCGAGLGLAICKQIVDLHEGSIDAKSGPGRGAAFIVRLPVAGPGGLL